MTGRKEVSDKWKTDEKVRGIQGKKRWGRKEGKLTHFLIPLRTFQFDYLQMEIKVQLFLSLLSIFLGFDSREVQVQRKDAFFSQSLDPMNSNPESFSQNQDFPNFFGHNSSRF